MAKSEEQRGKSRLPENKHRQREVGADFVPVGDCRSSDTSTGRRRSISRRLLSIVNDFQIPSNTAQSRRVKGCSKTFMQHTRDQEI